MRLIQTSSGIVVKTQVPPVQFNKRSVFWQQQLLEKRSLTAVTARCHVSFAQIIIVHQLNTYFHWWICGHARRWPDMLNLLWQEHDCGSEA